MEAMVGAATHGAAPRASMADHGVQCARQRGREGGGTGGGWREDMSCTRSEALDEG